MSKKIVPAWVSLPLIAFAVFGQFVPLVFYFAGWFEWISDLRRSYYNPKGGIHEAVTLAFIFGIPAIGTSLVAERLYALWFRRRTSVGRAALALGLISATWGAMLCIVNSALEWRLTLPYPGDFDGYLGLYWKSGFLTFSIIYGGILGSGSVLFLFSKYPPDRRSLDSKDQNPSR